MVYAYQPVNTLGSAMQGYQFVQGIQQQKAAQEQAVMEQIAQQQRQNALQEALATVRANPNPQNIADFYLRFPEMKEQFDSYREALAEGDKTTLESASREAIIVQQSGGSPAEVYERYAVAAENSRRPELVQQFRDAARMAKMSPEGADLTARMFYQQLNPEGYDALFGGDSSTAFQKDFAFIQDTFGDDAAAEFAQYGRGGVVSIPLGNGQTYVGPASLAPGASRWQQQGGQPTGEARAGIPEILQRAEQGKTITAAEARIVRQSLGDNGREAFGKWLSDHDIRIIARTGTDANGRRVIQFTDGTIEYAGN